MSDKKFIFNSDEPNTAISFNIPKKNNLDVLEFITLKGQDYHEITGLQEIHYQDIFNNHSSLQLVLENNKNGENDIMLISDEELMNIDLDSLNLSDDMKKTLEDKINILKSQKDDEEKNKQSDKKTIKKSGK